MNVRRLFLLSPSALVQFAARATTVPAHLIGASR